MFGKKTNKPQGRIDSLIGAGTSLEGDVTFTGGLRVDGEIKGNVTRARVTGDVEYSTIEMHLGAVVQGRLVHQGLPAKSVELKLAASN